MTKFTNETNELEDHAKVVFHDRHKPLRHVEEGSRVIPDGLQTEGEIF